MNEKTMNLGVVTAYAYAVKGGYTGTKEEFERSMANFATTASELESMKDSVEELLNTPTTMPAALPNPNKLTLTGAVNAEYDGSEPVEVNIPVGGGDSDDLELIIDTKIEEDVSKVQIDVDLDGNPFSLDDALVLVEQAPIAGATTNNRIVVGLNKKSTYWGKGSQVELQKFPKETENTVYSCFYTKIIAGARFILFKKTSQNWTNVNTYLMDRASETGIVINASTGDFDNQDVYIDAINFYGLFSVNISKGSRIRVWGKRKQA